MGRKTTTLSLAEDRLIRGIDVESWEQPDRDKPKPHDYVSVLIDGTAFERLLWREITHIIKKARLTDWQEVVFCAHLKGLSLEETAVLYHLSKGTVQVHLQRAREKCELVTHRGLLTVMIETLGWPAVREHLSDKLELRARMQRKYRTD